MTEAGRVSTNNVIDGLTDTLILKTALPMQTAFGHRVQHASPQRIGIRTGNVATRIKKVAYPKLLLRAPAGGV